MPNEPKPAAEKRAPLSTPRQNAQDDHEGSPHTPAEFRKGNPQPPENVQGAAEEGFFGSRAWEATSRAEQDAERGPTALGPTREERRVTPAEVARHATAQGTDSPAIPRGRNPDSAMCEDRQHPGRIDKGNDC